ncbi:unnamed protein product [Adineta ricciae]|uniref:Uncharacterized protein n=1 Tax=Adineta ricciae TaxID=249248 RepID=A0A814Z007_ADIRI|nr:unnamed protein product [Adineta ricciae]
MFRVRRGIRSDPRPSESNAIPSPGFHRIRRIPIYSDLIEHCNEQNNAGLFLPKKKYQNSSDVCKTALSLGQRYIFPRVRKCEALNYMGTVNEAKRSLKSHTIS